MGTNNSKVLALKYRPKNFDELIGQEGVSKTLKYSLANDSLANAYLFSGLRGSGKTSSARIFAKTILCEKAPTSKPCDICSSCQMANSNSHIDIIEMDAASNRKIDDIRDLIEQTQYQPSTGKYKIFIIDEVHMLTKEAFNALLKTLEEPPSYIKFILATTDPLKLPATILSRTQHFNFKRIDKKLISQHLEYILNLEGVQYDMESVETIARSGDGSLRDTLTILQQGIIYCNDNLNIKDITEMLGLIDPETLENILKLIIAKDRDSLLKAIENLQSYDAELIIDEFINLLKSKIFDNSLDANILGKIFTSLNSGKTLLFTGADSGFVLYLTFLQMISDEVEKRIVFTEEQKRPEVSETPNITNISIKSSDNDQEFFTNEVLENILMVNPGGKITDNMLKSCIEQHVKFVDFNKNMISVKFCFKENTEEKCKSVLRYRYLTITSVTICKFSEKYKQKTEFKYIKCTQENQDNLQKTQTQNTPKPETIDNLMSNAKEIFGISDRDITKKEPEIVENIDSSIASTKQNSLFDKKKNR